MAVVCKVAISCCPSVLRTMSSPLESGASRKLRSPSPGRPVRMVAVSEFSGLTSSAWALAYCWGQEGKLGSFCGYTTLDVQLALLNSAMTARFLRAAARRFGARSKSRGSIGFVLAILLAIRKIDLCLYLCVRFDAATLLSKVFGPRVAFARQQLARICRSSRASGAISGRREPNLSL
jgi:hypothetical protein